MKKLSLAFVLVFSLSLGVAGCGAALAATIAQIVAVASSAVNYVNLISDFADKFFAVNPNPGLQATVAKAVTKARVAAMLLDDAAQGADHLSKDDLAAAFANFRSAYEDLLQLTAPIGVRATRDGRMGLGEGGVLNVRPPDAFRLGE